MRHRDRMNVITTVVHKTDDAELVRLRVALARISESARTSEDVCKQAADALPYSFRKLSEGFKNLATHFNYIKNIAHEATNDH